MTPEQQRAIAIASARARLSGEDFAAIKADGAQGGAPMPMSPEAQSQMTSQISPYLPTERGTDVAGEIAQAPYNAGAAVNDAAAKYLPAPFAAGLGAATNAGLEGAQMVAGGGIGGAVGTGAREAAQGAGRSLMKSALKPTWQDQRSGKAARAIDTMLEDGYSPTRGGVDLINARIAALKEAQAPIAANSLKTGSADRIVDAITPVERRISEGTMRADALRGTDRVRQEFLTHPEVTMSAEYGSGVPVNVLQAMKEQNHRVLTDSAYGARLNPDPSRDALKALTRQIGKEIELAEPGVAPLNRKMSELLNAKKVAERRALMQGNNNPASLGVSLATMTNNPMLALGMWANSSSAAKAALARMLYTGGKAGPALGTVAGAGALPFMQDDPK